MKTLKNILNDIKISLFDNLLNRYFLATQVVLLCMAILIWLKIIVAQNIFIYSSTSYFPLQVYAVVMIVHLVLSIYSYKKDVYISNLLLGASAFYIMTILVLELLYIINR